MYTRLPTRLHSAVLCEKLQCHYLTSEIFYCLLVIENITLAPTNIENNFLNLHDLDFNSLLKKKKKHNAESIRTA